MRLKIIWKLYQNHDKVWIIICRHKYLEGVNSLLILRNLPKGLMSSNNMIHFLDCGIISSPSSYTLVKPFSFD